MQRRDFLAAALTSPIALGLGARAALANQTQSFYLAIRSEEAHAHGLPAMSLGFEYPTDKVAPKFPGKNVFAVVRDEESRTGGVWTFEVHGYRGAENAKTLEDFLRGHLKGQSPFTVGRPETVTLAREPRQALGCITGVGAARTEHCAVLLPRAQQADSGALVLLALSSQSPVPDCSRMCANSRFQPMMKSLVIDVHFK